MLGGIIELLRYRSTAEPFFDGITNNNKQAFRNAQLTDYNYNYNYNLRLFFDSVHTVTDFFVKF